MPIHLAQGDTCVCTQVHTDRSLKGGIKGGREGEREMEESLYLHVGKGSNNDFLSALRGTSCCFLCLLHFHPGLLPLSQVGHGVRTVVHDLSGQEAGEGG